MLKNAILKSYNNLMKENDNIPVGVRGELEVIVRDCNGNIISYDKDHNEITDWMKHSIIHLLAGNIFSKEYKYPIPETEQFIYTKMQKGEVFHSSTTGNKTNADGMLLTGKSYFHDGIDQTNFGWGNAKPSEEGPYICPTYPTKMLFGTGAEFSGDEPFNVITSYYGVSESIDTAESLEKFLGESIGDISAFKANINDPTNYYSNSEGISDTLKQCRSVQPKDFTSPDTLSLTPRSETGITGAIKDCLITDETTERNNYNSGTGMANSQFRGIGRPCFIYAERENDSFHSDPVNPGNVNINVDSSSAYEDKLTYSVVMPQNNQSEFYPYNGWILKEAGLFSDSILRTGSEPDSNYYKMPSGILLAKRYIKPVMKTADTEIEFRWSIYIAESSG